jgi:uncharacterized protein YecT (DUF1311 family)
MEEKMRTHFRAVFSFAVLCLAPYGRGQENPPADQKVLTPEQQAYQQRYREWETHYRQLQAQGKQIFDAEMSREKAPLCPEASSTYDVDVCYGKELGITEANLKNFETVIHDLLVPGPEMPGPEVPAPPGVAGPHLTPEQHIAEFESVEQDWRQYRDAACAAALHQFDGGTGGPSFELQCQIQLARDHMRELRTIYGESFL